MRQSDEFQGYRGQLRLPQPLADRLKATAAAEHRSMNGQIVHLLERALAVDTNDMAEVAATTPAK